MCTTTDMTVCWNTDHWIIIEREDLMLSSDIRRHCAWMLQPFRRRPACFNEESPLKYAGRRLNDSRGQAGRASLRVEVRRGLTDPMRLGLGPA